MVLSLGVDASNVVYAGTNASGPQASYDDGENWTFSTTVSADRSTSAMQRPREQKHDAQVYRAYSDQPGRCADVRS
jgi:hypothetical protein